MILSNSHKFIFARGIKTASTSIANELQNKNRKLEQSLLYKGFRRLPFFEEKYPFFDFQNHPHLSLSRAKKIIPDSIFSSCLKFGVVREPLSWMESVYKHWLRYHKKNLSLINCKINTLEDFILFRMDHYPPIQALQFIDKNGLLLNDVTGNFHQIELFTNDLSAMIGLKINIKKLNVAPKNQKIKTPKKIKSLIEKACQLDFELFDFENLKNPVIEHSNDQNEHLTNKLKVAWKESGGFKYDPWKFEKMGYQ